MRRWGLIRVDAGCEFKFREKMREIDSDVEVYVPSVRKMIKPRWISKSREVCYPAFAGYLLTKFRRTDERLFERTFIEFRVSRNDDGTNCWIREREIDRVKALEARGAFNDLPPDVALIFKAGTIIFIKTGQLAGRSAKIISPPKPGQKSLLADIFGKAVRLPLAEIEAIS